MSFFKAIKNLFDEEIHFEGTITATERIGARIQKVTISLPAPIAVPFPVGCYVQTITWGCIPRAYSVATATTTSFTLLVSFSGMGAGSRFFAESPIGTKVTCYGPFDDFKYHAGTGRTKIFFATSTGVAPFRRMVGIPILEGLDTALFLGTPKESDIAFKDEFELLARTNPHFHFIPVLSAGDPTWKGARGYVTDQFVGKGEVLKESDIYICGVPMMTLGVLNLLKKEGVPEKQIFVQKFG
jgi:NAD(P)H-flavin reductase